MTPLDIYSLADLDWISDSCIHRAARLRRQYGDAANYAVRNLQRGMIRHTVEAGKWPLPLEHVVLRRLQSGQWEAFKIVQLQSQAENIAGAIGGAVEPTWIDGTELPMTRGPKLFDVPRLLLAHGIQT